MVTKLGQAMRKKNVFEAYADSEGPDQPVQMLLLTRVFQSAYIIILDAVKCINPCHAVAGYTLPLQTVKIQISWSTDLDLHCLPLGL